MYPFYVFGLEHDATDEQVAERYHELVKQYPPDIAPEQFSAIRQAFEALCNQRQRLRTRLFYLDTIGRSLTRPKGVEKPNEKRPRIAASDLQALIFKLARHSVTEGNSSKGS